MLDYNDFKHAVINNTNVEYFEYKRDIYIKRNVLPNIFNSNIIRITALCNESVQVGHGKMITLNAKQLKNTPSQKFKKDVYYVNKDALVYIMSKLRNIDISVLNECISVFKLKNKLCITSSVQCESSFIDALKESLSILGITDFKVHHVVQHNDKIYKVDLYLPQVNLVIEYDENNHYNYSPINESMRQLIIIKELGCKVCRLSDSESNMKNCAKVIKYIYDNGLLKD